MSCDRPEGPPGALGRSRSRIRGGQRTPVVPGKAVGALPRARSPAPARAPGAGASLPPSVDPCADGRVHRTLVAPSRLVGAAAPALPGGLVQEAVGGLFRPFPCDAQEEPALSLPYKERQSMRPEHQGLQQGLSGLPCSQGVGRGVRKGVEGVRTGASTGPTHAPTAPSSVKLVPRVS